MRKQYWSLAYDYISKQEVTATLSVIEEAYRRVSEIQGMLVYSTVWTLSRLHRM